MGRGHPYQDKHSSAPLCLFWAKVGAEKGASGGLSLADYLKSRAHTVSTSCISGTPSTACLPVCPEKCWALGAAPGRGPVFPVFCRVPCSLIPAYAFMSEEPEQVLSILARRAGAGQVRAREGGLRGLGAGGRNAHAHGNTDLGVDQGDLCPAPAPQAVMKSVSRARPPWVSSTVFPIPDCVTVNN